jgi:hypothetical protein
MTRCSVLVLVAMVSLAAGAEAQREIPVGARVKLRIYAQERQVEARLSRRMTIRGELTASSPESLWVRLTPATGVVAVPRSEIRRLHESRGIPNRFNSMLLGAIGGAAAGALEGYLFYNTDTFEVDYGATSRGQAAARGAMYGGVAFGLINLAFPVERWRFRSLSR